MKVQCPYCGALLARGFAYQSHVNWHSRQHHVLQRNKCDEVFHDDDVHDYDDDDYDADEPHHATDDEEVVLEQFETVQDYFEKLANSGTLEEKHVLQYTLWGTCGVKPCDTKTLRFLRAMHGGTGASRRAGNEMLAFIHGLETPTPELPFTVDMCWDVVDKVVPVIVKCIVKVHCKVHCKSTLSMLQNVYNKYYDKHICDVLF
jgi:hypothetical protein